MEVNKKVTSFILSSILGMILINLGIALFNKEKLIAIATGLIGLALLIFGYYFAQIRSNEKKIRKIEEWIEERGELLNTLKDIVILKKLSKLK